MTEVIAPEQPENLQITQMITLLQSMVDQQTNMQSAMDLMATKLGGILRVEQE